MRRECLVCLQLGDGTVPAGWLAGPGSVTNTLSSSSEPLHYGAVGAASAHPPQANLGQVSQAAACWQWMKAAQVDWVKMC
jgi:hypothetical protein